MIHTMEEEVEAELPEDIWVLIFHKLAIRYVLRCKAVCKSWHSLISEPSFKSKFNIMNPSSRNQPITLLLAPPSPYWVDFPVKLLAWSYEVDGSDHNTPLLLGKPLPFPDNMDSRSASVLGSCNGLVALCDPFSCGTFSRLFRLPRHFEFYLFNPCTKEEKMVTVMTSDIEYCHHFLPDDYHPSVGGLCHDPATDEYTAVLSLSKPSSDRSLLMSFKGDVGSWKVIMKSEAELTILKSCTPLVKTTGTTVQGAPHWLCHRTGSVLYFDVRIEEYRMARLPKDKREGIACGLGCLDGQLTVAFDTEGNGDGRRCEVWALKEYGNHDSWRMLFSLSVDQFRPFSLLSWRKGEWVVLMFDQDIELKLVVYDIRLRRFRPLKFDRERADLHNNTIATCIPTFASPTISR